jgi:hypothetical protein
MYITLPKTRLGPMGPSTFSRILTYPPSARSYLARETLQVTARITELFTPVLRNAFTSTANACLLKPFSSILTIT